jgi:hypothetical protein
VTGREEKKIMAILVGPVSRQNNLPKHEGLNSICVSDGGG